MELYVLGAGTPDARRPLWQRVRAAGRRRLAHDRLRPGGGWSARVARLTHAEPWLASVGYRIETDEGVASVVCDAGPDDAGRIAQRAGAKTAVSPLRAVASRRSWRWLDITRGASWPTS